MKKRLLSMLLCLAMVLTLLPTAAFAAVTRLKSVDIVIELPKAGDPNEMETQVTVKSIKSGSIDLMANGATVQYTEWQGDDVITDNDEYLFRAGTTYLVNVKLAFDTTKGYCANYKGSDYVVGPDTFSATVNGVPATVRTSAAYFPTLQVSLTIPGQRLSETEKAELEVEQAANASALATTRRAMYPSVTQAEADRNDLTALATKVVTLDGSNKGEGYDLSCLDDYENMGTVILDADDSAFYNTYCAESFPLLLTLTRYVKEVWLSSKVDAYTFIQRMDDALRSPLDRSFLFESRSDKPFYTAATTLLIPEAAVPALKAALNERGYIIPYTIKAYSGSDVYAAQRAGASAAKEWCTSHKYTRQIRSADRAYTYSDCRTAQRWYYSCDICGKCERNANHVAQTEYIANTISMAEKLHNGQYYAELPNDSAYIGVNAAGEQVYWLSCQTCGKSSREIQQHLTAREVALSGTGMSLAQYQAEVNAMLKMQETLALSSTEVQPGMFTVRRRSDAKTSAWAQSDVNLALNDELLDTALLGGDYTKNITRLQFCAVAVRLAETLTGKSIAPAPAGTFTDTDNAYVRKAYAAGITTGVTATTFQPGGTLTRQQMAAFLYRTLRYVEKNSDYAYTSYTSKLASYKDNGQIQSWAKEPMAFMNALGLITGTTATTLAPNGTCTIEQAIIVAERSVYAHQIGWYQVTAEDYSLFCLDPAAGTVVNAALRPGDLVWVTGRRQGNYNEFTDPTENLPYTFVPAINPYTGQTLYLFNRDLRPIRN